MKSNVNWTQKLDIGKNPSLVIVRFNKSIGGAIRGIRSILHSVAFPRRNVSSYAVEHRSPMVMRMAFKFKPGFIYLTRFRTGFGLCVFMLVHAPSLISASCLSGQCFAMASFRCHLAMDSLVDRYGVLSVWPLQDFHLLVVRPAGSTKNLFHIFS